MPSKKLNYSSNIHDKPLDINYDGPCVALSPTSKTYGKVNDLLVKV